MYHKIISQLLKDKNIIYVCEYQFDKHYVREHNLPRKAFKYRFDFAILSCMVALEIEGGIYTQGRHTRSTGFIRDCHKYNLATMQGWRLIRIPTSWFKEHFTNIRYVVEWVEIIK